MMMMMMMMKINYDWLCLQGESYLDTSILCFLEECNIRKRRFFVEKILEGPLSSTYFAAWVYYCDYPLEKMHCYHQMIYSLIGDPYTNLLKQQNFRNFHLWAWLNFHSRFKSSESSIWPNHMTMRRRGKFEM